MAATRTDWSRGGWGESGARFNTSIVNNSLVVDGMAAIWSGVWKPMEFAGLQSCTTSPETKRLLAHPLRRSGAVAILSIQQLASQKSIKIALDSSHQANKMMIRLYRDLTFSAHQDKPEYAKSLKENH